jgi:hypothetical protein
MLHLATPIVDWTAMGKIFVAVLIAGTGVVILFGFMLLGLKVSQGPPTHGAVAAGAGSTDGAGASNTPSSGARLGGFTLALVCGLLVAGVIVLGVYAMTQKPSSKPAKPKSALVIPAGSRVRLTASSG